MGWPLEVLPDENNTDHDIVFEPKQTEAKLPSSTAIHEAGHALFFDALGVAVKRISISVSVISGRNLDGHVLLDDSPPDLLGIAGGLAGAAANIYIEGLSPNSVADKAYQSDDEYLRQKCKGLSSPDSFHSNWQMMHRFLHGWVRDWVRANREPILRLAQALDETQCLEGTALPNALKESWGEGKPDSSKLRQEIEARLQFI
jgi:hypothetical protein